MSEASTCKQRSATLITPHLSSELSRAQHACCAASVLAAIHWPRAQLQLVRTPGLLVASAHTVRARDAICSLRRNTTRRIADRSRDSFMGLSATGLAQGLQACLIVEAFSAEKNLWHRAVTAHKCCKHAFRKAVLSFHNSDPQRPRTTIP